MRCFLAIIVDLLQLTRPKISYGKPKKVTKLSRSNHALMCLDKFMALKEYIRGGQKSTMVILEGNLVSGWKGFDLDTKMVKVLLC